jgi:integrase
MLVKCAECNLQVSDKALACPHCGCPIRENINMTRKRARRNKRKRLPNGFGRITEIKGKNLRKPFRAMVTVEKDEQGRAVGKLLKPDAYFATYNEAYEALLEYNKNPYSLDPAITVKELYNRWTADYFKGLSNDSSKRTIRSAWAYCSSVYRMRASDLRSYHIKGCLEQGKAVIKGVEKATTPNIKGRIKSMFNLMLDYALEYEIVDRNYARTFDISDEVIKDIESCKRSHISFTDEEIDKLWAALGQVDYVDAVLIQCYSGWRPQELGLIELNNVKLDERIMIGGMKTDAGTERVVPIHSKILPLVEAKYREAVNLGSQYLINCTDTHTHRSSLMMTYEKYRQRFMKVVDILKLNPDHRAHDPRKQFVTMAKKATVDEYAIKYIVGHAVNDITEKVYTQRDIQWLKSEIEKIK